MYNANEIPDVQDGYGLMMSELLSNCSPNCSFVPTDLNSLQNGINLPNGEVMYSTADDSFHYLFVIFIEHSTADDSFSYLFQ
ncbi:UNVERIFIED_CONTAM: hypothetical protein Sindi_2627300 [Sesamum indicum]